MSQMDLFSDFFEIEEKKSESPKRKKESIELDVVSVSPSFCYGTQVEIYLQQDIQSAREITERLITEWNVKSDRYITDKPHLYIDVCRYLDSLVLEGKCRLISKSTDDRQYEWIGF